MTDSLQTKVARAICDVRAEWPKGDWVKTDSEGNYAKRTFLEWAEIDAQAAIAVVLAELREPTPAMIDAGCANFARYGVAGGYRAMIDAANRLDHPSPVSDSERGEHEN